jgi:predicted GNAT family N-acyltransferase
MRIRIADFDEDYAAIHRIRFTVFVDEQHVPPEIELDDRDRQCIHLLAFRDDAEPVGTGRIDLDYGGKIGRVAVLASERGTGVGRALMETLHEIANRHGLAEVWCNAQVTAVPFYTRLGYRVTSEPFDEAGIEHVKMKKEL